MRARIKNVVNSLTPSFVRRRYTVKFVVSILFVIVVISSVGMFGFVQAQDTVAESARSNLESTARLQADSITVWVSSRKGDASSLARQRTIRTGGREDVSRFLDERLGSLRESSGITGLHVVDLGGDVVLSSTRDSLAGTAVSEVDAPWAGTSRLPADSNAVFTSRRGYASPATGNDVVAFWTVDPSDDRLVVVEAEVGTVLGGEGAIEGQRTALVNANGDVVRPGTNVSAVFGAGPDAASPDGFGGSDATTRFTSSGSRVFASAAVTEGTGWRVVTSAPESEAFAVVDSVGQTIGLIIFAGLLSLGLVALVLGRQTVTPLSRLRRKVERMEEGDLDVDLESDRVDEVGQLYAGFASMRDSLRAQIRRARETTRHLERKATDYSGVMRAAGDGDLTARMDPESESEAMTEIAEEFNEMIADLERTTERVKNFAYQVDISSREVTMSSEEVRSASEQVSDSVREISTGADRQSEALRSISAEMDSLSATVDEINASSDEVAAIAAETVRTGHEGREAARDAIEDMDRVTDESEEAVEEIQRLERETEQIDELLEFIGEIARRTNMLALNANIEATRSVESGDDGFGVIANEIKQLSEETQNATENIERRLERIKSQTADAAEVVQGTSRQVQSSAENVREAVAALEEVTEYAEATNEGVQSISEANEGQVESTVEVADRVEDVAEISERTSRESETVSTLAAEQTTAVTQVSESARGLSDRADRLGDTLDSFRTDAAVEAEIPDPESERSPGDDAGDDAASFAPEPTDDASDDAASFAPEPTDDASDDSTGSDDVDDAPRRVPTEDDD
jgi:methyl-accepting chemotaxis protein